MRCDRCAVLSEEIRRLRETHASEIALCLAHERDAIEQARDIAQRDGVKLIELEFERGRLSGIAEGREQARREVEKNELAPMRSCILTALQCLQAGQIVKAHDVLAAAIRARGEER